MHSLFNMYFVRLRVTKRLIRHQYCINRVGTTQDISYTRANRIPQTLFNLSHHRYGIKISTGSVSFRVFRKFQNNTSLLYR